jgi:hypothetical protein
MLQQAFPLQEYDGSHDNLVFGQGEIVKCGGRYQIDLVEELAVNQLDIACRIARRVVKFLDLVMLGVPKRGSRGKRRRRRHENDPPGAVLLRRSQDRDNTASPPIGQHDARCPDFDLFAVGQIA